MNKERPTNLSVISMRFPVTAIASIFHRISGLLLFLLIPFLLWCFSLSLEGAQGFVQLIAFFKQPFVAFVVWVLMVSTVYHLTAGIKHLLMDVGFFETKHSGRWISWAVLIFVAAVAVFLGGWLWG